MGAQNSTETRATLSPRTLKHQLSDFIYASEHWEQQSVVKSPDLYDNETILSDEEGEESVDHTPLSPNALSWLTETTPSTVKSIHCEADAYKILSGREDSLTVSEVSISRAPSSPVPELQLSLSPRSDIGEGFFPPTPRGCNTPRSRTGTICTPTDVRRLSATQNLDMDLQDSPKGARLSRRGGMCAQHDYQVPESIRSIRTSGFYDIGGTVCPEGEILTHKRARSTRHDWTPRTLESISSEVITPPHRTLRRARTEYALSCSRRIALEVGGTRIPY